MIRASLRHRQRQNGLRNVVGAHVLHKWEALEPSRWPSGGYLAAVPSRYNFCLVSRKFDRKRLIHHRIRQRSRYGLSELSMASNVPSSTTVQSHFGKARLKCIQSPHTVCDRGLRSRVIRRATYATLISASSSTNIQISHAWMDIVFLLFV